MANGFSAGRPLAVPGPPSSLSVPMDDSQFPAELPVFPLTGVLLLPGMVLPLHVFEPRYRNMVAHALAGGGHIGMIQPVVPGQDNRPQPGAELETPALYPVGCAGRIEHCEETPDGRYLIQLVGAIRFRVAAELPPREGYRRVRADYGDFAADLAGGGPPMPTQTGALLEALGDYGRRRAMQRQPAAPADLPPDQLVNGLAMSLPFFPPEKQALLEAVDLPARTELLIALLRMDPGEDPENASTPAKPS